MLGFADKITWAYPNGDLADTPAADGVLIHIAIRATDVNAVTARVRAAGCKVTVEPKDVTIQTTNGAGPVPVSPVFWRPNNPTRILDTECTEFRSRV